MRRTLGLALLSALSLALSGSVASTLRIFPFAFAPATRQADAPEMRGAWVQAKSLISPERIDEVLRRAEAGHFDAIFVGVFASGQTLYDSALAGTYEKVEPGFNPLAYLVPEAHRRGIEVHAWFPAGRVGREGDSPLLAQHPDWGLVGPDGETTAWLNFTRPDVRQFIGDLMLEAVEQYGVDGLHFDYTRYPGPEWGFDPYSIEAFTTETGLDLNQLRYADLPAYGTFEGNPLTQPGTAQVLATFGNGLPAVTLNRYGEGEVVVLNWVASRRSVAVGSEIMQRSLRRWLQEGGQVHVLRSETTLQEYGEDGFENGRAWLEHLGWMPLEVTEAEIENLGAGSVLVLPNVYLISSDTAVRLADFVRRGGGMVFIDGPTPSMHLREIRAITGMMSRGRHFEESMLLLAAGEHPLIPASQRSLSLETYQAWDTRWKEFRRRGISALIKEVYERVKAKHSDVDVSVTITSDQDEALQRYLQDWPAWLQGGYVDFLIPRGYVKHVQDLVPVLTAWQPTMRAHDRVILGLKVFTEESKSDAAKSPDQLLTEIEMARSAGSLGVMIFDLDRMSDEQLAALAAGPFSAPVSTRGK